jgi:WD40 repeat protein
LFQESEKLPAPICSLAVSADGQWLASGDLNNQIHIFNLDTMQVRSSIGFLGFFLFFVFAISPFFSCQSLSQGLRFALNLQ